MKEPYTLLWMKATEPCYDIIKNQKLHYVSVAFVKTDNIEKLQCDCEDIMESYITFYVGQDVSEFITGLRNLANKLEEEINHE